MSATGPVTAPASIDDEVVDRPEHLQQLLDRRRVVRPRAIDLIAAGQDVEAGLVLDDELAQEFLIEPVKVVDGVDQRESRPDAEKQRDLAKELVKVDHQRRPLREPGDLYRGVHGERGRADAALGAEKRERYAGARAVLGRAVALDGALERCVKRLVELLPGFARRPGEVLVGAGAHGPENLVWLGRGRDREDRRRWPRRAQALDRLERRDVPLRMSTTARSGQVPPACFSSTRPIDSPLDRRSLVTLERKSASLVVITAESCAMAPGYFDSLFAQ